MFTTRAIFKLVRRFAANRGGNFAIITSLLTLPMIGMLGLATDYSMAIRYKTTLDASADAAALAAITEAGAIINQQSSANYDPTATAIATGNYAGNLVFTANSGPVISTTNTQVAVNVVRNGSTLTSTVTYTAASPNHFGTMFGSARMNISGSATSSYTLPKYMNIYVLVDTSQSMGIAATQTDMNNLSALTGGCVFGCHVVQPSQPAPYQLVPFEQVAHNHNITLRIDVISQAIQTMIASAQSQYTGTAYIQFSLYTMPKNIVAGDTSANQLTALNSNYSAQIQAAKLIDLGPNNSSGIGDSTFSSTLMSFLPQIPTGGDGSGPGSPLNFLFIMTDGVQDVYGGCTDGHCTQAFDPGLCTPYKTKNITVGVIYTTYLPFPNEQTYIDLVQPFANSIAPNLKSCASNGYYYEATDGPAIQTSMQALFAQATAMARLTR
jgi:Flp pilus assembly protein TadG